MKIIMQSEGLGNQMLIYIVMRCIEEASGEKCYVDDMRCFHKLHTNGDMAKKDGCNGYEIGEIFGIRSLLLSESFSQNTWEETIEQTRATGVCSLLKSVNPNLKLLSEGNYHDIVQKEGYKRDSRLDFNNTERYMIPMSAYSPKIAFLKGDIYYSGCWCNPRWFLSHREMLLEELRFPPITDACNKTIEDKIIDTNSVGIHVRRGDFVEYNCLLNPSWYPEAVGHIKSIVKAPEFFVFSDDPDWCESHTAELGLNKKDRVTFVRGNVDGNNFRDMQLMSLCKNLVIANSTFSFMAALLNQNTNKLVLSPSAVHSPYPI